MRGPKRIQKPENLPEVWRENQWRNRLIHLMVQDLPPVFWGFWSSQTSRRSHCDVHGNVRNTHTFELCHKEKELNMGHLESFRSNRPPAIPVLHISPVFPHFSPPFPKRNTIPPRYCAKATGQLSRHFLLLRLSSFPWKDQQGFSSFDPDPRGLHWRGNGLQCQAPKSTLGSRSRIRP